MHITKPSPDGMNQLHHQEQRITGSNHFTKFRIVDFKKISIPQHVLIHLRKCQNAPGLGKCLYLKHTWKYGIAWKMTLKTGFIDRKVLDAYHSSFTQFNDLIDQ